MQDSKTSLYSKWLNWNCDGWDKKTQIHSSLAINIKSWKQCYLENPRLPMRQRKEPATVQSAKTQCPLNQHRPHLPNRPRLAPIHEIRSGESFDVDLVPVVVPDTSRDLAVDLAGEHAAVLHGILDHEWVYLAVVGLLPEAKDGPACGDVRRARNELRAGAAAGDYQARILAVFFEFVGEDVGVGPYADARDVPAHINELLEVSGTDGVLGLISLD